MSSENRRCSVIIPAYNAEDSIYKSFKSVGSDISKEIDITIVDDGSWDNSSQFADSIAFENADAVVIHKKNQGVSAARNSGMQIADGEYLYFMDSDDTVHSDVLEKMLDEIKKYNADIVVGDYQTIDKDKKQINAIGTFKEIDVQTIDRRGIEDELLPKIFTGSLSGFSTTCNKIYKASFVKENKILFDVKRTHGEDWMFNLRLFEKAQAVCKVNEVLYDYYIDGSTNLSKYNVQGYYSIIDGLSFKTELCEKYNLFEKNSDEYIEFLAGYALSIFDFVKKEKDIKQSRELLNDRYVLKLFCGIAFSSNESLKRLFSKRERAYMLLILMRQRSLAVRILKKV